MLRARLLLLFCVIVWGWTFVATKICLSYMSPVELLGLRFLVGIPVLALILVFKRIPLGFVGSDAWAIIAGSVTIIVHFLLQAVALTYTSATNTGWIIAVTPLALALLSFAVLGERLKRHTVTGVIISSLGILTLVSRGRITQLGWLESVGDWMILASAHTWAFYTIFTRDLARRRNPLAVTLAVFSPLLVVSISWMIMNSDLHALTRLPTQPIVALLFLGIFGTIAQWFWQIGVARIGATRAGLFLYLEPVATTALAVPLLGEKYGVLAIVGSLFVLSGVWWAERRSDP